MLFRSGHYCLGERRYSWGLVSNRARKRREKIEGSAYPTTAPISPQVSSELRRSEAARSLRRAARYDIGPVWGHGAIVDYEFYISADNADWKLVDKGEFTNIKNNRVWQIKNFDPTNGRFIKLRALRTADGNNEVGYAEIDIMTR